MTCWLLGERSLPFGLLVCICENKGADQRLYFRYIDSTITLLLRGVRWLSGTASDSEARGWGFETYLCCVVFLSKTLYFPKSTGYTQEAVALSLHD